MSIYRPERDWPRYAPVNKILVSVIDRNLGRGYGEIHNISESGACFIVEKHFEPDSTVLLRLAFHNEPELFVVEAEIVWSRRRDDAEYPFAHGVKFRFDDEQRRQLKDLLESRYFKLDTPHTGKTSGAGALDDLMHELTDDLDRFASSRKQKPS